MKKITESFSNFNQKVNLKYISRPIILALLSFSIMLFLYFNYKNDFTISIIIPFLSTLITSIVVYSLWEIYAKRRFAIEVLELQGLSKNLIDSGIVEYYDNFRKIDWDELLKEATELKIFACSAITFLKKNHEYLDLKTNKKMKLSIYYPNFKDNESLNGLNFRFNFLRNIVEEQYDTQNEIKKSILAYKRIGATTFMFNGGITLSYYIVNNQFAIISFFNHSGDAYKSVPALKVNKGSMLFSFVENDFSTIEGNSKEIIDEK